MRQIRPQTMIAWALLCLLALLVAGAAETPRRGGILTLMVAAEPPSFDGHRESSFAMLHPLAPFYSTLIRVNPENPASPTDFVGDLALDVPEPTDGGKPYLDGFRATFAEQQAVREQAIRDGQALIEFRGFPPRSRDILQRALGDQLTVQESDWNCALVVVPNHLVKPFDDPHVRRALTLAIDRWGGSEELSKIAIVKSVGGIVFPGHPLAATPEELREIAGYWPDLEQSRAEARRLLREAGVLEGFSFPFHIRDVDQPYNSILKFFQVDSTGMFRMTSSARYFKEGVGSSRPNWRWIMCFLERPKANTSWKAWVKRFSLS